MERAEQALGESVYGGGGLDNLDANKVPDLSPRAIMSSLADICSLPHPPSASVVVISVPIRTSCYLKPHQVDVSPGQESRCRLSAPDTH